MYERMLDKQCKPTYDEFTGYCGACKSLFEKTDDILTNELNAGKVMRFPYGSHYGWGMKYSIKNRHICDIFAEKDAFTVMLRMADSQFKQVYDGLSPDTKKLVDNKYPCGSGGWIHYRVLSEQNFADIIKLLRIKVKK